MFRRPRKFRRQGYAPSGMRPRTIGARDEGDYYEGSQPFGRPDTSSVPQGYARLDVYVISGLTQYERDKLGRHERNEYPHITVFDRNAQVVKRDQLNDLDGRTTLKLLKGNYLVEASTLTQLGVADVTLFEDREVTIQLSTPEEYQEPFAAAAKLANQLRKYLDTD